MNKHVEKAMELRNAEPMVCNCAQTILRVYAEELGLSEKQADEIGANFGGGMKCDYKLICEGKEQVME